MKFLAQDPKSKAGPLLWNKYVFFIKWKKFSEWVLFFVISPIPVKLHLCVVILMKKNIVPG